MDYGPIYLPADNEDGWVKTYWNHHSSLGYLPDVNRKWTSDIQKDLDKTHWLYFKLSGHNPKEPQEHFVARPNQLPHYRDVQLPTGKEGQYDEIPRRSIAGFTWSMIEERAFTDPPTIRVPKDQYYGRNLVMGNLESLHKIFQECLTKRDDYRNQEAEVSHSCMYDDHQGKQTNYLVIITDGD